MTLRQTSTIDQPQLLVHNHPVRLFPNISLDLSKRERSAVSFTVVTHTSTGVFRQHTRFINEHLDRKSSPEFYGGKGAGHSKTPNAYELMLDRVEAGESWSSTTVFSSFFPDSNQPNSRYDFLGTTLENEHPIMKTLELVSQEYSWRQ